MDAARSLKWRTALELGLGLLSTALFVLTLITREWIEALTGFDPDHHNGSLEWAIVAVLAVVAVTLLARARVDWRKLRRLPA